MKIEAINGKPRQVKLAGVKKADVTDPTDSPYSAIGGSTLQSEIVHSCGVQRNATTACIKYKIQGISELIELCPQNDDTPRHLQKREPRKKPGRLNKFFLCKSIEANKRK